MICRIPGASFVVGDVMGYLDCLSDCHRGANNMYCTVYCYMIGIPLVLKVVSCFAS